MTMFRITCRALTTGDEDVLLIGRRTHQWRACPRALADQLLSRAHWTAEDLGRLVAAHPGLGVDALLAGGFIDTFVASERSRAPACVAVLTADRPECCERAVRLVLDAVGPDRLTQLPILVLENSTRPELRRETLARLFRLVDAREAHVLVCLPTASEGLRGTVAEIDPTAAAALAVATRSPGHGGPPIGAARNLITLLTRGDRVLSLDDDVTGPVLGPPWTQASYAPTVAAVRVAPLTPDHGRDWQPVDLIDQHLDWLGSTVGGLGDEIVLTASGLRGDCATDAPWLEIHAAAQPRPERLTRQVVRGVLRPTITPVDGLLTVAYGCCNVGAIPPFMPAGRGEDGAFAAVMRAWRPHAQLCNLPAYVRHVPPRDRSDRTYRDVAAALDAPWRVNDLIGLVAALERVRPVERLWERLTALGHDLQAGDVARLQNLHLQYRAIRLRSSAEWILSSGWRMRTRISSLARRWRLAADRHDVLPLEFRGQSSGTLGRYLVACASMLREWPRVLAAVDSLSIWQPPWTDLTSAHGVVHVRRA